MDLAPIRSQDEVSITVYNSANAIANAGLTKTLHDHLHKPGG